MRESMQIFMLVLLAAASRLTAAPASGHTGSEGLEYFEKKIRPVLVDSCYKCHSPEAGEGKLKGGLRLDTREGMLKGGKSGKPAVVPGNAEASQLVEAIR